MEKKPTRLWNSWDFLKQVDWNTFAYLSAFLALAAAAIFLGVIIVLLLLSLL